MSEQPRNPGPKRDGNDGSAPDPSRAMYQQALRTWFVPFGVLLGVVVVLLFAAGLFTGTRSIFDAFRAPNPELTGQLLGATGQIVAQVLGVAISVVAIIVELAANRYTHRITSLFFSAPANFAVMGFFVVSSLHPMWVSFTYTDQHAPPFATGMAMMLMSASMLLLLPYFSYVASFVNPLNVITRIKAETLQVVERAPKHGATQRDAERLQLQSASGADQLSDVAFNSMQNHDNGIAMAAINALGDLLKDYLGVKQRLPGTWFQLSSSLLADPDFVSMAPEAQSEIEKGQTWYEFKLLRQYEQIYRAALNEHRELNYIIATNVKDLAVGAMERQDKRVVDMAISFFNTFLRATVNSRDVRTGYNVLNQYRLLAEAALRRGEGRVAVSVAKYFKYYGQLAFHMDLGFILETAAYDLCTLNELALDLGSTHRAELLRVFLQVDKEGEGEKKEAALRGVRKAQVKLATYYLVKGDVSAAREVYRDMANENPTRLASIRDELLSVESPYFWEITDRGTNFDWMPQERKQRLLEFFEWFGDALPDPRASVMPPAPAAPVPISATTSDSGNTGAQQTLDPTKASAASAMATGEHRPIRPRKSTEEPAPRPGETD